MEVQPKLRPKPPSWKQLCCSAQGMEAGEGIPRERPWMGKGKEVIREAGRSPGSGQRAASCSTEGEVRQPLPVSQGLFSASHNPSPQVGALQGKGLQASGGT